MIITDYFSYEYVLHNVGIKCDKGLVINLRGGGGLQNGKIASLKLFAPPPPPIKTG